MQKEMGNQSTSGILEQEKNANGAIEEVQEISSSDDLKEENKILIQENETKDVQEKSQEAEADKSSPVQETTSGEKAVNEDYEARTTALDDVPSNVKEPDMEKGVSAFDNEVHDQPCSLSETEEEQISEFNFEAKSMSISTLPQEAVDTTSELQEDRNKLVNQKQISEFNIEAKATSISSLPQEDIDITSEPQEGCKLVKENGEELGKDPPQDEQDNSFDTRNDLQTISLQDLSIAGNEKQDELLVLDEEKHMTNEVVNEDQTSYDQEEVLLNDEAKEDDDIDQICSSKSLESNSSEELKDTKEVVEVLNEVGLVQSISTAQDQDEEKPAIESSESEKSIAEECATRSQSLVEIEKANEFELADAETQPILEESEFKGNESKEKIGADSNLSHNVHQVELKKSPSFDFGIPFDPKSEESDQTPLLYQDRPPMRSFSSCSGLRFQNRSVQTEYIGKSLHYETVEVEEKTIRMERSHSESLRTAAKEKQDNLNEDCDIISPRGNGKRKPRSSLFTTCICCTAAIS